MAKITRVVQKIFGSNAGVDQRSVFGSLAAGAPAFSTDPETIQSLSNYLGGWFTAVIGGNAPAIEDMNALQFLKSRQLAYLFQAGIAEWEAQTTYYIGSMVNDAGKIYVSKTDDNLNNPVSDTTNWKIYSTDAPATGKDFWGSTLPEGWIWADAKTIGSAASGATNRANADTIDLYTVLWNDYSNTLLPIQDSAGVATTRGASAAADFAANKRLPVIDKRGRVSAGLDNMGGSAASRLTSTTMTPNGTTLGATGGTQTHVLTTAEMPTHNHGVTDPTHTHNNAGTGGLSFLGGSNTATYLPDPGTVSGLTRSAATGITINNNGSSAAHLNVQPTIACNYILKL